MTKQEAIQKVLDVAKSKNGYLEKSASAYNKDHSIVFKMTEGAGNDNRCEAWELLRPSYNKQSCPWCQGFMHLIFYLAFGETFAKKMLYLEDWQGCEPYNYYSCAGWSSNFEAHGARYQSSKAQVGDLIFFTKTHVGIVVDIRDGYVYTCEGNTSGASGVIRNGGGVVWGKKYKLGSSEIKMYGRPNWEAAGQIDPPAPSERPVISKGYRDCEKGGNWCLEMQQRFNKLGITDNDGDEIEEDGRCGARCAQGILNFQSKYNLAVDGYFGPACWAKSDELLKSAKFQLVDYFIIASKNCVCREKPNLNSNIITVLLENKVYHTEKQSGNWQYIESIGGWVNNKDTAEYIFKMYSIKPLFAFIRKGPGKQYKIKNIVIKGTIYASSKKSNNWYYIDELDGWIKGNYLMKNE